MYQVVLYISTMTQACLAPSPQKVFKPLAYCALSPPYILHTLLSPTLYKKKLVIVEQKPLLLLGWVFQVYGVILKKSRNVKRQ